MLKSFTGTVNHPLKNYQDVEYSSNPFLSNIFDKDFNDKYKDGDNSNFKVGVVDNSSNLDDKKFVITLDDSIPGNSKLSQIDYYSTNGVLVGWRFTFKLSNNSIEYKFHGEEGEVNSVATIAADEDILCIYGVSLHNQVMFIKILTSYNRVLLMGEEIVEQNSTLTRFYKSENLNFAKLFSIYDKHSKSFLQVIFEFKSNSSE